MPMNNWMKIAAAALTALSAAAPASAGKADGGKPAAVVLYAKGGVQIMRAGTQSAAAAAPRDLLYPGDELLTGADGQAAFATRGAEIRLNHNSALAVETGGRSREIFTLRTGQLWTRLLNAAAKLDVRTPSATCVIRGTEADIEQRALLTVKVYRGDLEVRNGKGRQAVAAGQMSVVPAGAAPGAARQMSISDMGDWQQAAAVKDMKPFLNELPAGEGEAPQRPESARDGNAAAPGPAGK